MPASRSARSRQNPRSQQRLRPERTGAVTRVVARGRCPRTTSRPAERATAWADPKCAGEPRSPAASRRSAAIADGVVYAASSAGAVAALRLGDGRERWRREIGTVEYGSGADRRALGFFAGVALTGRRVLVASDRVHCLDARSGRPLWQSVPLRTPTSDDYFWGLPAVVGELVLIGSGSGAELPTARGRLSAYRLRDGGLAVEHRDRPGGRQRRRHHRPRQRRRARRPRLCRDRLAVRRRTRCAIPAPAR